MWEGGEMIFRTESEPVDDLGFQKVFPGFPGCCGLFCQLPFLADFNKQLRESGVSNKILPFFLAIQINKSSTSLYLQLSLRTNSHNYMMQFLLIKVLNWLFKTLLEQDYF